MIVSSAQFSLKPVGSEEEFWRRVEAQLEICRGARSSLVVFPEYFTVSWLLSGSKAGFRDALLAATDKELIFTRRFQELSDTTGITIVAGTLPRIKSGEILNRCWIFRPGQAPLHQEKVHMTRFEAEEWRVEPGEPALQLFSVGDVLCAVAICYDVEFPAYTAAAAEAGVELLLVPSCTDDIHGYWRVRHTAQARAIENQCYVVTSSIVEGDPARPEISVHYGQGGVFTPCDSGFPEGGVLSLSDANSESVIFAKLDLDLLRNTRKNGSVLNLRDSSEAKRIEIKRQ